MRKLTVLICDDNIAVYKSIESYLIEEGLNIIPVYTGDDAIQAVQNGGVDLMVLDIMLPGKSGIEVCREVRKFSDIPILMLSAKETELDRIVGLEVGADDYVTKPFSPREVAIRVHKMLKRLYAPQDVKKLVLAELAIYPERYEAYVNDVKLDLTPKEVRLLSYLVYNVGKVLSREIILSAVWDYDYTGDTRTVDTHVKRLRQKLPVDGVHFAIRSVYGIGYKLEELK